MTDDACYCYMGGGYLRYLPISPNGVSDFASYRAEHYAAVILGVESRSSSAVRIPRDPLTMQSVSTPHLYPCGEGAGYAGGITSSALDGINVALKIAEQVHR